MVLIGVALAGVTWWGLRMEPHWAAKDGLAFTCRIQRLDDRGVGEGRWHDARGFVEDGCVTIRLRSIVAPSRQTGHYQVLKRLSDPPKGKAVFLVDGEGVNGHGFAALRLPASSRATDRLEAIIVPA